MVKIKQLVSALAFSSMAKVALYFNLNSYRVINRVFPFLTRSMLKDLAKQGHIYVNHRSLGSL